jgi:hypothetical protein
MDVLRVWGAAIDSTQQQQEQAAATTGKQTADSVWEKATTAARRPRARGWYYQVRQAEAHSKYSKLGEALAGPEGWRKCSAVERCVWRIWTQETHPPVHADADQDVRGEAPKDHLHRRAAALEGYVGGTNAAVQDATPPIAAMQAGAPGPTFTHLARQREHLPIDTGEEPLQRTGGTAGSSHTYCPRESCAYACR